MSMAVDDSDETKDSIRRGFVHGRGQNAQNTGPVRSVPPAANCRANAQFVHGRGQAVCAYRSDITGVSCDLPKKSDRVCMIYHLIYLDIFLIDSDFF